MVSKALLDRNAQPTRREIIEACLDMEAKGINQGTSGNISCRSEDGMLITPTAMAYDALQPGDIVRMNLDGETEGPRKPSSEWRFHLDILRERPDVGAVEHEQGIDESQRISRAVIQVRVEIVADLAVIGRDRGIPL